MKTVYFNGLIDGIKHIEANPLICFDFDGVLHNFKPPWKGDQGIIEYAPIDGAKEFVDWCRDRNYFTAVHSVRSSTQRGRDAIKKWLDKYDITMDCICAFKPLAVLYIDDRGLEFTGNWGEARARLI